MKLVLISDTHGIARKRLPEGDVLVHAGDLTMSGMLYEIQRELDWLKEQPFEHIVIVAGNHDFAFEREGKKAAMDFGRITYLENSGCEIEGIKFYGSPVQPWFYDWAFNVQRGPDIRKYWEKIPEGTDVLITHGPPKGIGDYAPTGRHVGCDDLLEVIQKIKPKINVFGHIHEGYGEYTEGTTRFFNASMVNGHYRPVNEAFVTDL